MWSKISEIITNVIKPVSGMIDGFHTSGEEKLQMQVELQRVENELTTKVLEVQQQELINQKEVLLAEMKGNWLQRSWRPILMLVFGYVVLHNCVIVSLFSLPEIETPPEMWQVLKLCIGGYTILRSGEKITEKITSNISNKK